MAKKSTSTRSKTVKTAARKKTTTVSSRTRVSSRSKTAKPTTKVKIIKHHAKSLYHMTPKFIHGMVVGAFVGVIVITSLGLGKSVDALTISTTKDKDGYSIIYGGIQSSGELQKDYNKSAYIRHVYGYRVFGISSTDMANIGKTAVKGVVHDDGTVRINGKVVAKKAITAARKRVTANDKKVTYGGSTFYTRYLSTSWSHKYAAAYVVMKNGVFDYAVLAPCGNPIVATPTTKPPTTPAPPPPTTNHETPTPNSPPPTQPTPEIKTTPTSTIKTLPNTGPGAVLIVVALSVLGGAIFHKTHHHVKHRRRHSY